MVGLDKHFQTYDRMIKSIRLYNLQKGKLYLEKIIFIKRSKNQCYIKNCE